MHPDPTIIPLTQEHIESPSWDSSDEFEQLHGRLLWHLRTPYAHAVCAEVYEEPAGMGTAVRFGDSARITACKLVTGHDAGRVRVALVDALLEQLHGAGCTSTTITVQPAQVPLWEALGFVAKEKLLRYSGGRFYEPVYPDVVWNEPQHRMAILHMDSRACGVQRADLLMEHSYLGRVYLEGARVRGFAWALLGEALIVADAPHVGLELQRWIFPTQEHLLVPEGNSAAHDHLLERGYTAAIAGVRMVHGEERPYKPESIFAEPYGAV